MKNIILKGIALLAFSFMVVSGLFINSRTSQIIFLICLAWFVLFEIANKDYEKVRKDSRYEK